MALFGGPRNYASIVAPLRQMVENLNSYMDEMATKITGLEQDKAQIEAEIKISQSEITKSNFTTTKINDLLGTDLDEDGIADIDELPPPSDDTPVE